MVVFFANIKQKDLQLKTNIYFYFMYKKKNKYNVSKKSDRTLGGKAYMSKLEMQYRKHLELLKRATNPSDKVIHIDEQVPFQITINDKKICKYLLDFEVHYADGRIELIDVKGFKTAIYKLKKKMVEAQYNVFIKEVTKASF